MKKLGGLLLAIALLFGFLPQTAMASEVTSTELDLSAYLTEISASRGYEIKQQDIELSLYMFDKSMADFSTVDEISDFLGEVIVADLSNLEGIYSKYSLDQTTLTQTLEEYGEVLDDYIFLYELDSALDFYNNVEVFEREADFDTKLAAYLTEVSSTRDFEVTVNDINEFLSVSSLSIDGFETVADLKVSLGDIIAADLNNLDYFMTNYDLDEAALLQLLADNGESINDFVYVGELEYFVWSLQMEEEQDFAEYMDLLNQIGLTQEEITNLKNHLAPIMEYIASPEGQAEYADFGLDYLEYYQILMDKVAADENYQASEEDYASIVNLMEDVQQLFQVKLVYSIIKDGIETQYTFLETITMDPIEDADYKMTIYNDASELLADVIITSEFINSYKEEASAEGGIANDTGSKNEVVQTVKGGELPKTAGNYVLNALIGFSVMLAGFFVYKKVRNEKGEVSSEDE